MPTSAVLFDFDGVIVDSENIHIAAWQRILAQMAWELTDDEASPAAEIDDRIFVRELFERNKLEVGDLEGWVKKKQVLAEMLLADAPRIYRGVVDLIRELVTRGVQVGIITINSRRNVELVIESAGLSEFISIIVAREDVKVTKPGPEPYLRALELLNKRSAETFVIEDSPVGVESARKAGIRVLAVGHRRADGDWTGGSYLSDLADTQAVLMMLKS